MDEKIEIFRNRQWLVTENWVDRADGLSEYNIPMRDINKVAAHLGPERLYEWPPHMATKIWVDVEAFNEAFVQALRFYSRQTGEDIDEDMLSRSLIEAIKIGRGLG